jgi:hypothetical protein
MAVMNSVGLGADVKDWPTLCSANRSEYDNVRMIIRVVNLKTIINNPNSV